MMVIVPFCKINSAVLDSVNNFARISDIDA